MKVRYLFPAMLLAASCTNQQIQDWLVWYQESPEEALEFANLPAVQEALNNRGSGRNNNRATSSTNIWDRVAECESGQNWSYNGGSGYDGGLQFLPGTWRAYGGREFAEFAHQASREQQIIVAERVLADVGWRAWPACSRKLGLR